MANNRPLVEADPAMMKLQFIRPPKKAASPVNAPRINPRATASSPKTINLANQGCVPEFARNSIKDRYQSTAMTGLGVILRPRFQNSNNASPVPIHLGSTNLCQP